MYTSIYVCVPIAMIDPFVFFFLIFWPRGMWDLSSPTRDGTHAPCIGRAQS